LGYRVDVGTTLPLYLLVTLVTVVGNPNFKVLNLQFTTLHYATSFLRALKTVSTYPFGVRVATGVERRIERNGPERPGRAAF
jgi:hypothetical protein